LHLDAIAENALVHLLLGEVKTILNGLGRHTERIVIIQGMLL
jgi:hypothetical protein